MVKETKTRTKTRILLLEDDVFHRSLLAEGLEEYYEFEVARAATVSDAEEQLRKVEPDLLLLDCVLGDNEAQVIDWARKIRQDPTFAAIPILFVTAFYRAMEEQTKTIENSAILAKPFTFEDVTEKMHDLLVSEAQR